MSGQFTHEQSLAIQGYRNGALSIRGVAGQLAISKRKASELLETAGVKKRSRLEAALARRTREGHGTSPSLSVQAIDDVVARYHTGEIVTQREAAHELGVSQPTIHRYLVARGKTPRSRPEINSIRKERENREKRRAAILKERDLKVERLTKERKDKARNPREGLFSAEDIDDYYARLIAQAEEECKSRLRSL